MWVVIEEVSAQQWRARIYKAAGGLWRVAVGDWRYVDRVVGVSIMEVAVPP
jgi:hypothetical protein